MPSFNYRVDTNKVAPGEGGFHIHVYNGRKEVAKISGQGNWVKQHGGKTLLKPTEVLEQVRGELRRIAKRTRKELDRLGR